MRLRRNPEGWNARGVQRRDWRQDKSVDGPVRPPARKKDTKRWCRGVQGREHRTEWQPWRRILWMSKYRELACTVCGKQLRVSSNWEEWRDTRWPR